jgi:hypothetical protein
VTRKWECKKGEKNERRVASLNVSMGYCWWFLPFFVAFSSAFIYELWDHAVPLIRCCSPVSPYEEKERVIYHTDSTPIPLSMLAAFQCGSLGEKSERGTYQADIIQKKKSTLRVLDTFRVTTKGKGDVERKTNGTCVK